MNHELLTNSLFLFKFIVIFYDGKTLVTSRKYFLTHGKVLKFSHSGFEPQVFLPLAEFGIDKARYFEANETLQNNLFGEAI